jgi:hypothetical protein
MSAEVDIRHEKIIQIAMLLAEKNGYPVDAWRLFEWMVVTGCKSLLTPRSPPRKGQAVTC